MSRILKIILGHVDEPRASDISGDISSDPYEREMREKFGPNYADDSESDVPVEEHGTFDPGPVLRLVKEGHLYVDARSQFDGRRVVDAFECVYEDDSGKRYTYRFEGKPYQEITAPQEGHISDIEAARRQW